MRYLCVMKTVQHLLELLQLEQIEENLFRGHSTNVGSGRVFGGQVLAQSLRAAAATTPNDRILHSLHGYFLLAGDLNLPIVFEVDRIRDGGSFTTRRVRAIQKGHAIFLMSASFQKPEPGFDHHLQMPNVSPPENLVSWDDLVAQFKGKLPANIQRFLEIERPIEFRPVELFNPGLKGATAPVRHVWMRAKGEVPTDIGLNQAILAYASDYNLLTTAILPHGDEASLGDYMLASLDHAMWFHRPFRMDNWLLYAIESPSASGARGLARGSIFTREGVLVASVVQEGLMRYLKS
jgi:acyl-CoA thioesterase-2